MGCIDTFAHLTFTTKQVVGGIHMATYTPKMKPQLQHVAIMVLARIQHAKENIGAEGKIKRCIENLLAENEIDL